MYKKILSIILMVALAVTMVPLPFGAAYAETSGTEKLAEVPEGYIGIYTKEDLNNVRNNLGGNYILMNDIEFTEEDFAEGGDFYNEGKGWIPIGQTYDDVFKGILDGNGYSIKSLYINVSTYDCFKYKDILCYYAGLFGFIEGQVRNLEMSNIDYDVQYDMPNYDGSVFVGGIAGLSEGIIDGCTVTGNIEKVDANVTNCIVNVYGAGLVGRNRGVYNSNVGIVRNCTNSADIETTIAAGIVGYNENFTTIEYCNNQANITSVKGGTNCISYAAGVIGECSSGGTIRYCYNAGNISGYKEAAGFIASSFDNNISYCYNLGDVNAYYSQLDQGSATAGGFAAYSSSDKITDCFNAGNIMLEANDMHMCRIGGFVGSVDLDAVYTNCYTAGVVNVKVGSTYRKCLGDFSGEVSDTTINNCYYLAGEYQDDYGTGLVVEQMKQSQSFVGFDFEKVWTIDSEGKYQLPYIRGFDNPDVVKIGLLNIENIEDISYTGQELTPNVVIKDGDKVLISGQDYVLEYSDNVEIGVATVTITGLGDYSGSIIKSFNIVPAKMEGVTIEGYTGVYDGKSHTIRVIAPEDVSVKYSVSKTGIYENEAPTITDVGTLTVYYKLEKENYETISGVAYVVIEKASITDKTVCLEYYTTSYDGNAKKPSVTIEGLTEGEHFTVTYENNTHAGNATAVITGIDNYTGIINEPFMITSAQLSASVSGYTGVYDGAEHGINVYTPFSGVTIKYATSENGSYTTSKPVFKNVGEYKVYYLLEKDNYADVKGVATIKITPASITQHGPRIIDAGSHMYDGKPKTPGVSFKKGTLIQETDYTLEYKNNVNAGTAKIIVTGVGNYEGTEELDYEIYPLELDNGDAILEYKTTYYDGAAKTPKVVSLKGFEVTEGVDYIITYSKNVNIGETSATIKGIGNFTGTIYSDFEIKEGLGSKCTITLSTVKYTYNGKLKTPSVTVKSSAGKKLVEDKDYYINYDGKRKEVGRYSVTIDFIGKYSGKNRKVYFYILPKAPSSASTVLYGYDDVKISWKKSSGASGYNIYYKSSGGKYKLLKSTTGTSYKKANLSDGVKYYFKVVPYTTIGGKKEEALVSITKSVTTLKKVTNVKAKKSSSKVKISWSNIGGETGYQISQSTSKSKTNVVATYKTTSGKSKTISASKGKTYYYKVRAYKTVGDKKIYGPWSSVVKYKR